MNKSLIELAAVGLMVLGGFFMGQHHGETKVQAKWDKEKQEYTQQVSKLQTQLANAQADHELKTQKVNDELQQAETKHQSDLADLRHDYDVRLRDSQNRAAIYQRQAQGGSLECNDLASYTAKLDRSLEEGRSLVRELGATLRLRDEQLVQVGNQLRADRSLFTEYDNGPNPSPERDSDSEAHKLGEGTGDSGSEIRSRPSQAEP